MKAITAGVIFLRSPAGSRYSKPGRVRGARPRGVPTRCRRHRKRKDFKISRDIIVTTTFEKEGGFFMGGR